MATLLSGCSGEPEGNPTEATQTTAGADEAPAEEVAKERPPLSEYVDARDLSDYRLGSWVEYWMLASTPLGGDDETVLNFTSEKYVKTNDAFARREFQDAELAAARETLKRFDGQRHIVVRWGRGSQFRDDDFVILNPNQPGAYDFETNTFAAINPCKGHPAYSPVSLNFGSPTSEFSLYIQQLEDTDFFCQVRVEDLELAEKIEKLRAGSRLELSGDLYLDLDEAKVRGEGTTAFLRANVRAMSFEFWDSRTGEKIGAVSAESQL